MDDIHATKRTASGTERRKRVDDDHVVAEGGKGERFGDVHATKNKKDRIDRKRQCSRRLKDNKDEEIRTCPDTQEDQKSGSCVGGG